MARGRSAIEAGARVREEIGGAPAPQAGNPGDDGLPGKREKIIYGTSSCHSPLSMSIA